jgi:hypothetical protein
MFVKSIKMDINKVFLWSAGVIILISLIILIIIETLKTRAVNPIPLQPSYPDSVPMNNLQPANRLVGGCHGTVWGCCPDGVTARVDPLGSNC